MGTQPPTAPDEFEQLMRQSLLAGAQSMSDRSSDILKWSLGALLAVNGGAIVALLGSDELRTEAFKEAAFYFGGGLLSALIGGMCWAFGFAYFSADGLRRAWDRTPLSGDELENLKTESATRNFTVAGFLFWCASFGLFAFGCIATAFVPQLAEYQKLGTASREATARFVSESKAVQKVFGDKKSTPEQRQGAIERARVAQIEAEIAIARVSRALGEEDDLMKTEDNSSEDDRVR
jgi:hypothetical protein